MSSRSVVRPIPVNPGGVVAPENAVGRERDAARVLAALESVGVELTGERRMGKTVLAGIVERDARERGWSVVRISVEGRASLAEFTSALVAEVERHDGPMRRAMRSLRKRLSLKAGPVTIAPEDGARSLDEVVAAAAEAAPVRLLLTLDELPIMVRKLETAAAGDGATALHALRRLRQAHPEKLRMLCLGSIGFHHVADKAPGSLNDMTAHRLGPLESGDAVYLARCLMLHAGVETADDDALAEAVAEAAERVPYYVHHIVSAASSQDGRVDAETVPRLVEQALASPDDPWYLRHYRQRLGLYYAKAAPLARAVLDAAAGDRDGVSGAELDVLLSASLPDRPSAEDRRRMLELLEADHYLIRDGDGWRFAFDVVRRAWLRGQP